MLYELGILLTLLDSPNFRVREAATREVVSINKFLKIEKFLADYVNGKSPEVHRRCVGIIEEYYILGPDMPSMWFYSSSDARKRGWWLLYDSHNAAETNKYGSWCRNTDFSTQYLLTLLERHPRDQVLKHYLKAVECFKDNRIPP